MFSLFTNRMINLFTVIRNKFLFISGYCTSYSSSVQNLYISGSALFRAFKSESEKIIRKSLEFKKLTFYRLRQSLACMLRGKCMKPA